MNELSGKRVLVTGADGFIGSHLTERLVRLGADVRALCVYNSTGSYGWLDESEADVVDAVDLRLGDIRDPGYVTGLVGGIDVVLHLAALIAIPYSYAAPQSYVETNVTGSLNVLEACRTQGVSQLVHTSTSEVYGTPDSVPISETHTLKGQSPYSASKIAADKLCEAYACSFELPVTVLRPFNTFGPRQSARAVIPTIIGQLLAGKRQIHLGDLRPKRDLTFVADTVEGFIRAATTPLPPGEVVQLGTGRSVSVGEIVSLCCLAAGTEADVVEDSQRLRPAASEVMVLQSDPSRAEALLGWSATTSLEDGLRQVVEWMQPRVDPRRASRYQT